MLDEAAGIEPDGEFFIRHFVIINKGQRDKFCATIRITERAGFSVNALAAFRWCFSILGLLFSIGPLYALVFLVGGAFYSAIRYKRMKNKEPRFYGNVYIAIGGLLPGIGGTFTRMGYVNVLYVTELAGLILIYIGYLIIKRDKHKAKV